MKKCVNLLILPLITVSFLANCGGNTHNDSYHIVTFESNGGTHIDTQRVRDGGTVTEPEPPTSEYGTFLGWFKDSERQYAYEFNTPVTDDLVLYADWDKTINFTFIGEHCTIDGKDNFVETYDYGEFVSFKIDAESVGYSIEDHIEFTVDDIESSNYDYNPTTQIFSTSCKGDIFLKISSEKMTSTTIQLDTPDGLTTDYIINFDYVIENDDGPFFVDWGDGNVDSRSIHPYLVSTRDPLITIYGNISKLAFADEQGLYATFNTLVSEVNLANTVNLLPDYAFKGCTGLKTINLAQTKIIGDEAFSGCTSLTNVSTPEKMTSIGEGAFKGCSNLTKFAFPTITPEDEQPENKKISQETFKDCTKLDNITIPDDITVIEDYAFSGCSSLSNINLPTEMYSIGKGAFKQSGLKTLAFPSIDEKYEQVVGEEVFMDCSSLESIEIPSNITTIKTNAFRHCTNLGNVVLYGITKVESPAFSGCAKLKLYCANEYTDQFYFQDETETGVEGEANAIMVKFECLAACLDTTGNYACLVNETESGEQQITVLKYYGSELSTITIPGTLKIEDENAGELELPVAEIGYQAFAGHKEIYTVDFTENPKVKLDTEAFGGSNVEALTFDNEYATRLSKGYDLSFGDRAFAQCNFDKVNPKIPLDAVTHMGSAVFDQVTEYYIRETSFYCENDARPVGWNADWNKSPSCHVPISYNVYFGVIKNCNEKSGKYNVDLLLDNPKTRSEGTEQFALSICRFNDAATIPATWEVENELTIENEGVESTYEVQKIGDKILQDNKTIKEVKFADNVVKIGNNAFSNSSINSLVFNNTSRLQAIGDGAFSWCDNLEHVDIHHLQNLTHIFASGFYRCGNLSEVYLPTSVKRIDPNAFASNEKLSSFRIDLDNQVEFIGDSAFSGSSLNNNKLTFNHVISIGASAFNKTGVSELTLLAIETLNGNSLQSADDLTKITLGAAFKKFDNCAAHSAKEIDLSQVNAVPVGTSKNAKITDSTTCEIKVPNWLFDAFKSSIYWRDLNIISI